MDSEGEDEEQEKEEDEEVEEEKEEESRERQRVHDAVANMSKTLLNIDGMISECERAA